MSQPENDALFTVIVHLTSSALTCIEEPPVLAAFRMVDAANRLIQLSGQQGPPEADAFLGAAHADYLEHMNLAMTDQPAFEEWLADYGRSFAHEARRRNLEA